MFDARAMHWIREPRNFLIESESVQITTEPGTDLWQRTYYGFSNDNAPLLLGHTAERFFSFTVKTCFESKKRYDQCGIVVYVDSGNWLKASVEYEDISFQRLGSVVTTCGYSDWATTDIPADIRVMWYRLSRRNEDFRIECSRNGQEFSQMRICHLPSARDAIPFGIYACSPEESSFTATFSNMSFGECVWVAHNQPPL